MERALLPEFSPWNGAGQKGQFLFILVHFLIEHLIEHLLGDRSCPEGYHLVMKQGQQSMPQSSLFSGVGGQYQVKQINRGLEQDVL